MKRLGRSSSVLLSAAALPALAVYADVGSGADEAARAASGSCWHSRTAAVLASSG